MVPVTALGKLIATCTIFAGLVLMALPVGIIATAFAEQIQRRDFIVTWGMISRVPLFTELDANEISDIMELLRAQVAEPGEIIMRAGDAARSMYFIAAGEVEIETRPARCRPVFRRSRACCGGHAAAQPLPRSRVPTCWGSTRTICMMQRDRRIAERIKEVVEHRVGKRSAVAKQEEAAVEEK